MSAFISHLGDKLSNWSREAVEQSIPIPLAAISPDLHFITIVIS